MKRKYKIDYISIVFALIIGILIGSLFQNTEIQVIQPDYVSKSEIMLVAVDDRGQGLIIPLKVEARAGDGKVLTNIDKLLFWVDTQYSIQTAKEVAEEVTGVDANNYDIIYMIEEQNATIIGGPSAGAALAIATVSVLENKTLNPNVMITGSINEDGSIGQVGAVLEKAKVAKENGATLFLVPKGQAFETYLEPEEECTRNELLIYCQTTYKQITYDIGEEAGIEIIEVYNINEAMDYF